MIENQEKKLNLVKHTRSVPSLKEIKSFNRLIDQQSVNFEEKDEFNFQLESIKESYDNMIDYM